MSAWWAACMPSSPLEVKPHWKKLGFMRKMPFCAAAHSTSDLLPNLSCRNIGDCSHCHGKVQIVLSLELAK